MNGSFARRLRLPLIDLETPKRVLNIEGKPLGKIWHAVELPVRLDTHENLQRFYVCNTGGFETVLGFDWLQRHNPDIDWEKLNISFPSAYCQASCCIELLQSAMEEPYENPSVPLANQIPMEYHEFLTVFGEEEFKQLPPHREYDIPIDLEEGKTPPFGPIYSMTPAESEALKEMIDEGLATGKIRHSKSPAGAPVMFVKKSDGSLRLVVDYRKLNDITIKNRYPLPRQDDLIAKLQGAKLFTKLDLRWGYNNVRVREGDEWKTAFRTKFGHFEYLVMPFGLTNAPAAFQHFMNDLLRDLLDVSVIVYLDDILIFSKDPSEHAANVKEVLRRLKENQLFCKASKCFFNVTTVPYLGLIISVDGISMDEAKVKAVKDWPVPTSVKEVQSFLGFVNFYRRFIKSFSQIARSLHDLTVKGTPWSWGTMQQLAFDELKHAVTSRPVLVHADLDKPFFLETDASGVAMGAVLNQRQEDGRLHPIAFMSESFSPAERNYDTHDKELLAIIRAFENWRIYLEGTKDPVTVFTDHKNLEYWKTARNFNRRHARWHLILAMYNFVIAYRPGKQSEKPDALSRRADYARIPETAQIMIPESYFVGATSIEAPTEEEIRSMIRISTPEDVSLESILHFLGNSPDKAPATVRSKFKDYMLQNGLLRYQNRIVVPDDEKIKRLLLLLFHDSPISGHPGQARSLELVSRNYYWPGMKAWINRYVEHCDTCQRIRPAKPAPLPLQTLEVPTRPFSTISYDMIVKLPKSGNYDSILVVIDSFTKFGHFIPCRESMNASELAQLFLDHVWKLHGTPDRTISDRGPTFKSHFLKALYQRLGIRPSLSSAFHPETDGQTERVNQTVEHYLRAFVSHKQDDWVKWLSTAEFSYNNAAHSATGTSPFYALYGQHPSISPTGETTSVPAADEHIKQLTQVQNEVLSSLHMAKERMRAGNKTALPDYKVGDKVWLDAKNIETQRPSKKLDHQRLGPFKILEQISPAAYRLDLPATMKAHNVFYVGKLSPYRFDPVRVPPPPPAIETPSGEDDIQEVEKILDGKRKHGKWKFLVKWVGFGPEENEWLWEKDLTGAKDAVKDYKKERLKLAKEKGLIGKHKGLSKSSKRS
ncbi:Retrotransposable element Tf2 protein [Ceratobasidium sp. AG-Ba]|nr:Retrotransposable element Tf2 protein [Ceratobasidium sp. AG-Ba]